MSKAVDVHIHPPPEPGIPLSPLWEDACRYFGAVPPASVEEMAAKFQEVDIFANLLASDARSARGELSVSNDYVAGIVKRYPETFMAFGSVDPWLGRAAIYEIERCAKELGLKGMKFLPSFQEFFPNELRFYPLWEKCQELGMPIMIHSGTTGMGAGMPGGRGLHLKYAQPIPYIDDIAADFPQLTIILAHPSWPWQEEQLAVALHKGNVYLDLSGWSPKYFSPSLVQYANTLLQDKVMFGSDYPMILPERWLADFEKAPFKDEVRSKILRENAKRVLDI